MKKIIFGMLLAVCMMVIVMPMTVYAKRWCEICNNWQDTTVIWKYGDEEHHLGFSTCKKCGTTVESGWEYHSGSGTATCTRGITCDVCGSQYGVLGHDYKLISTRPATCLLAGTRLYQCSRCSDSYSEPIPAPGHDMEEVVYTKATCTKEGVIAHLCRNNCGYFYTERIDATGHDWYSNWITDENNHWHKCNVCNEKKDVSVHTWDSGSITIPATCTTPGQKTYTCTVCCDRVKTEVIAAPGHALCLHDEQKPTCTTVGWNNYYTCMNCDYTTYQEIAATDHSWNTDFTIDQPATCTETGSQSIHCRNCDAVKDATEIPATGHSFGEWQTVTAPTCTENGSEERICSVCQTKETREISAINHNWDEGKITTEPTVDQVGIKTYTCKNCNATKTEEVPKLPVTEPETEPATEPETEPATEPETEPATEPETEPATEPATEPTTEPATEPATEPTTKKPHEIPETEAAPKTGQPANPTTTAAPKTGDDTNVTLWILLAVLSAGSFALLGKRKNYR